MEIHTCKCTVSRCRNRKKLTYAKASKQGGGGGTEYHLYLMCICSTKSEPTKGEHKEEKTEFKNNVQLFRGQTEEKGVENPFHESLL